MRQYYALSVAGSSSRWSTMKSKSRISGGREDDIVVSVKPLASFVRRLPRESRLWPQRRSLNHSGFLFLISYHRDAVERLAKLINVRRSRLPSLVPRHKPVGLGTPTKREPTSTIVQNQRSFSTTRSVHKLRISRLPIRRVEDTCTHNLKSLLMIQVGFYA